MSMIIPTLLIKFLTPGNVYNKENMKKCISVKLRIKLILKIGKVFKLVIMRLLVKNWNTNKWKWITLTAAYRLTSSSTDRSYN